MRHVLIDLRDDDTSMFDRRHHHIHRHTERISSCGIRCADLDLTEDLVLGWVKNHVRGSGSTNYMEHINHMIQKEITANKWVTADVTEADLPWSPTSGSVIAPQVSDPAPV